MTLFVRHVLIAMVLLTAAAPTTWAFETPTHGAMTSAAVAQSKFTNNPNASSLLTSLGLVDYGTSLGSLYPPFGKRYVDLGTSLVTREGREIENGIIDFLRPVEGLAIPENYSLEGWLLRGAIREDDNTRETPNDVGDEPGGAFDRVFGHFFDPQNDRGLSVPVIGALGAKAVDWALEPTATVLTLTLPSEPRKNHFKVSDAREAMWRALTLTRLESSGALSGDVWPTDWPEATKEELRKAYWATTFRALGDAVHLLQDMAQPQHTRNDAHSGQYCLLSVACPAGHTSFFEKYLEARTTRSRRFSIREGGGSQTIFTNAAQLEYSGYPNPEFSTYAEYFSTGTGGANSSGKGLANYSNRGFYSFGTNVYSPAALLSYPSPPPTGDGLLSWTFHEGSAFGMTGQPIAGSITFKTGSVSDFVTGQTTADVKLTTSGAWDQFLKQKNPAWSSYTLNYYNYDDQAKLLVKRAVGYSAGFIDYFFRGEMKITLPDDGVYGIVDHTTFNASDPATGFRKIKLKVENTTPAIGESAQDMTGGRLVAVAKFRRNANYVANLSKECGSPGESLGTCRGETEEILVSSSVTTPEGTPVTSVNLPAGAPPQELHFAFDTAIPLNVTDLFLQVVYRGPLGSEADAVVVETRDIPEPTYLTIFNATDSLICVSGAWGELNPDGTVPEPLANTIRALPGSPEPPPGPLTSPRVGVSFKAPFTYPLTHPLTPPHERQALVNTANLAGGQYIRMAILTDDATPFAFDVIYFDFHGDMPFNTIANGISYPNGTPVTPETRPLQPLRGTNHVNLRFAYRSFGAPCTSTDWPTVAGGYPTPVLVPIDSVTF